MKLPTFRHIYYYVPPCPRCGSRKTGRYIRAPFTGSGFTKEESLKKGELIRFSVEEPINNGFCVACGNEWPVRVKTKFLTYAQIQEEQIARDTKSLYEQYLNQKARNKSDTESSIKKKNIDDLNPQILQESKSKLDPEIIDLRQRDCIELIYADESLLEKVRITQDINM